MRGQGESQAGGEAWRRVEWGEHGEGRGTTQGQELLATASWSLWTLEPASRAFIEHVEGTGCREDLEVLS